MNFPTHYVFTMKSADRDAGDRDAADRDAGEKSLRSTFRVPGRAYNEMTKKKRSFNDIGSSREGVTEKFVYYFSGSGKGLTMK